MAWIIYLTITNKCFPLPKSASLILILRSLSGGCFCDEFVFFQCLHTLSHSRLLSGPTHQIKLFFFSDLLPSAFWVPLKPSDSDSSLKDSPGSHEKPTVASRYVERELQNLVFLKGNLFRQCDISCFFINGKVALVVSKVNIVFDLSIFTCILVYSHNLSIKENKIFMLSRMRNEQMNSRHFFPRLVARNRCKNDAELFTEQLSGKCDKMF